MRKHAVLRAVLGVALTPLACVALFNGSALAWSPEPAHYGVVEQQSVPVTMSDGTVLRANVYDQAINGKAAPGAVPGAAHPDPVRQGHSGRRGGWRDR